VAPVLLLLHAVKEKSVEYAPRRGSPAAPSARSAIHAFGTVFAEHLYDVLKTVK
jgi:hypothetical protein